MRWSKERIWEWYNDRPYDPKEIKLIKEFCELADAEYEASKNETIDQSCE